MHLKTKKFMEIDLQVELNCMKGKCLNGEVKEE